ncbi:VWA domain-containing protein [soil metagenome]
MLSTLDQLGAAFLHGGGPRMVLAADSIAFNRPHWLWLILPVALLLIVIARRSISGMGTRLRRVALSLRIVLAACVIATVAEPMWQRKSEQVAVTTILDVSRSQPPDVTRKTQEYLIKAGTLARDNDLLGLVTAAREAYVQQLPRAIKVSTELDTSNAGPTDATNLESAVRMALAAMSPSAANRIILVSDGNETAGSVLEAAKAAKAAGIPIDVLPIRYQNPAEVLVERMIAPTVARQGENAKLRVVLTATRPARGMLSVLMNGEPIDLNGEAPGVAKGVELTAGINVQEALVRLPRVSGPVRFEAVFEPLANADGSASDTVSDNNRAMAVTFVGGEGRALVLASKPEEAAQLVEALREAKVNLDLRSPSEAPVRLDELAGYECVVMVNTPRYDFTQQQQEELKVYVNDLGGGLIMIGGDESFGAGGWIGSALADALPIKLDPPQKREMPRGALVLVMHSCEMPEGNYWGRRTGEAAITSLSSKDMIGIIEHNWQGGDNWIHPLSEVGDKSAALRSINSLTYGDAPSFDAMLGDAYKGLIKAAAGQKHVVVISDGDPQLTNAALLTDFVKAKITISTVAVFPHSYGNGSGDLQKMRKIADDTGGKYYEITGSTGNLKALPEIFIKEAKTIKRSLIQESEPFVPAVSFQSEALRGIGAIPPITGYVVAGDREGLSQVVMRGKENDPILAQWQFGLGRVVTFTSDATGKWAKAWMPWNQYKSFWEQHVRWAMRPVGSPNVRVVTEERGEQTAVIVEALDEKGERLNFLRWMARIVRPDLSATGVELRQVGPGRYEALVPTAQAGAYTINMGYQGNDNGKDVRGSVQAAVTRPFADEFRALHDNAALLQQVAEETGGRVITVDEEPSAERNPWRREGVRVPISLQPIFLTVAMIALGLMLVDVGVRRVRLDPRAIVGGVAKLFRRGRSGAGEQMGSLRAARDKARERIDAREGTRGGGAGPLTDLGGPSAGSGSQAEALAQQASAYASAKFEASAEELRNARGGSVVEPPRTPGAEGTPKPAAPGTKGPAEDEGMSRLLKAKKRAQEDRGEG